MPALQSGADSGPSMDTGTGGSPEWSIHEYRHWGLTTGQTALSCDSNYELSVFLSRRETDVKRQVKWSAKKSRGRTVLWDMGVVTHACKEYQASLG